VIRVIRERCVKCGACAARAPTIFTMGEDGIAQVKSERQWWAPTGDAVLGICPTHAIIAEQTWPPA
jgi:ferredoxin